jgi:hypothetical protein
MPTPDPAPFTVSVHAGFSEDGILLIDARLSWHADPPPLGSDLLGQGRMALLEGIGREVERGRSLNAMKVRVHMEGHDQVGEPDPGPEPYRPA